MPEGVLCFCLDLALAGLVGHELSATLGGPLGGRHLLIFGRFLWKPSGYPILAEGHLASLDFNAYGNLKTSRF